MRLRNPLALSANINYLYIYLLKFTSVTDYFRLVDTVTGQARSRVCLSQKLTRLSENFRPLLCPAGTSFTDIFKYILYTSTESFKCIMQIFAAF